MMMLLLFVLKLLHYQRVKVSKEISYYPKAITHLESKARNMSINLWLYSVSLIDVKGMLCRNTIEDASDTR